MISPTRELASQISQVIEGFLQEFPHLSLQTFIGGTDIKADLTKVNFVSLHHKFASRRFELRIPCVNLIFQFDNEGGQILVATPGRLEDLVVGKSDSATSPRFSQGLKKLEVLVLDEADRLLSMGFQQSLNSILAVLPKQRRTGLFSGIFLLEISTLKQIPKRNPFLFQPPRPKKWSS